MAIRRRAESPRRVFNFRLPALSIKFNTHLNLHRLINQESVRASLVQHLPAWLLLLMIVMMLLPNLIGGVVHLTVRSVDGIAQIAGDGVTSLVSSVSHTVSSLINVGGSTSHGRLAPLFTRQVDYWSADIERWAAAQNLDPNLLATVMQIESCGHPTVSSSAGAQGLFQVMPFHFATSENQLDPNTNAARGADFLRYCLESANGDSGRAMACYNGGPSVLQKDMSLWASETQRYYRWGTGIYADAMQNRDSSATLTQWLEAGGAGLCQRASSQLGLGMTG